LEVTQQRKIIWLIRVKKKKYVQEVEVTTIRGLVIIHRRHTNILFADYTFPLLTGALKIQDRKTTKRLKNEL
jgi:hypothetical protein